MPLKVHEIDPLADTVIILSNPCRNFAPWDESLTPDDIDIVAPEEENTIVAQPFEDDDWGELDWGAWNSSSKKKKKRGRMRNNAFDDSTVLSVPEEIQSASNPVESFQGDIVLGSASGVDGQVGNTSAEPAEPVSEPTEFEPDEIHYLVSSRHLILASPWFRRTLTKQMSAEALKDPSDGRYHIPACDWDEDALLILLNIFHIRTRQVPATVSLEMLAKIAVLVDYYELEGAEVMERDTKDWIADVKRRFAIPSSYCRDLMLWICISRVFCLSKEFEEATAVAIKESHGYLRTLDLPIQQGITSRIDRTRCDAIELIMSELHRLLEVYQDLNYSCSYDRNYSFQCGAYLFGSLYKNMKRWGYLSPRPESPFMGMSLVRVCNEIQNGVTTSHQEWARVTGGFGSKYQRAHPCGLKDVINEVIRNAMTHAKGLKLEDFTG